MNGLFLDLNFLENIPLENLENIIVMDREYFPFPWEKEQWLEIRDNHNYMISIFESDKLEIGFCLFFINKVEGLAHLLKILILPQFRNKGSAKRYLGQAIVKLKKEQLNSVYLEVESNNEAAICLYKSLGFQALVKKQHFYGAERHAESMSLCLS